MTQNVDSEYKPGRAGGNRVVLIVTALLGICIVLTLFAVGVVFIVRLVSGPEPTATPMPTLRPTFTPTVVVTTATATPQPTVLEPTATEAATEGTPGPTPTETQPGGTAGPTSPPSTKAPATDTPSADTPVPPTPTPTKRSSAPPPGMASPDYGIQAFLWWQPEVAHRDLGLISDAGFTWVKQWFAWDDIEGAGKGKYDWETSDRIVNQVEEFGLNLIVRVDHAPAWAGPPPGNVNHFADFLSAMAKRYKGRVHAYQVWNEPNLAREWGNKPPNAKEYTQMLKKAYQVIKKADPNAIVVTAGMAPTTERSQRAVPDTQFIQAMYDAGAKGHFDMLGAHGAGYRAPPEMDPGQVANDSQYYNVGDPNCPGDACRIYCFRHVEDLHQIMVNNGDSKKRVVVLEFGWTIDERTDSPYYWHRVDDQFVQGDYMMRAYKYAKEHWTPWIAVMSLIYMPDVKWTKSDEQYWWSIIEPSPVDQLYLKAPYVVLCDYIRNERGLSRCPYLPE